jgi:hypothetical protein
MGMILFFLKFLLVSTMIVAKQSQAKPSLTKPQGPTLQQKATLPQILQVHRPAWNKQK